MLDDEKLAKKKKNDLQYLPRCLVQYLFPCFICCCFWIMQNTKNPIIVFCMIYDHAKYSLDRIGVTLWQKRLRNKNVCWNRPLSTFGYCSVVDICVHTMVGSFFFFGQKTKKSLCFFFFFHCWLPLFVVSESKKKVKDCIQWRWRKKKLYILLNQFGQSFK